MATGWIRGGAAAVVLLVGWSSPCFAWWEYAKWGMTRDQLTKASGGKAHPEAGKTGLYIDGIRAGGLGGGTAAFEFDDAGRLKKTVLIFLERYAGSQLKSALSSVYGKPVDETPGYFRSIRWRNEPKGTAILLRDLGDTAIIEYEPMGNGL